MLLQAGVNRQTETKWCVINCSNATFERNPPPLSQNGEPDSCKNL